MDNLPARTVDPTQELADRGMLDAFASVAQDAMEMDLKLLEFAADNGFARSPDESVSMFLGRFCLYLAQMYLGMRGNPQPIPRICTCTLYSDEAGDHEYPCALNPHEIPR